MLTAIQSISQIDSHDWDNLISDSNFYNSYRWISGLEKALSPIEILTIRGSHGLVLGCPLWRGEKHSALFYAQKLFADIKNSWQEGFIWAGAQRSTHNELAIRRKNNYKEVLSVFTNNISEYASQEGKAGFIVPYMPFDEARLLVRGTSNACLLVHDAEANQDVPANGLQEVLSKLKRKRRTMIKSQLRVFKEKGNHVRWSKLTPELEESIIALITANRGKYGSRHGPDWMARVFQGQRESGVIDSAIVALCENNGCITAATVAYHWANCLYPRYFGSDYTWPENDFRYFVLTYYSMMDYAAQHDINRIMYSISALEAKAKRGCIIDPLVAVVGLVDSSFCGKDVDIYNQSIIEQYRARYGPYMSSTWSCIEQYIRSV